MRSTHFLPLLALSLAVGSAGCSFVEVASVEGGELPPVVAEERCDPDDPRHPDCAEVSEGAGDEPIMAPDIPVVDVLQQAPRLVTPDPDAVGGGETFPLFLQEAVVDGRALRVSFSGGTPPCFVLATAEVVERDDEVIVNVRAGTQEGTDHAVCTTVVEMQQVEIELSAELGDRLLLDGSRVFQGGEAQY